MCFIPAEYSQSSKNISLLLSHLLEKLDIAITDFPRPSLPNCHLDSSPIRVGFQFPANIQFLTRNRTILARRSFLIKIGSSGLRSWRLPRFIQDHGSVRLNLPSFHELLHYESFVNISREGQGCKNTVLRIMVVSFTPQLRLGNCLHLYI